MKFLALLRFTWRWLTRRAHQPYLKRARLVHHARPQVEAFEDRLVPSGNSAVFYPDQNSNGGPASTVNTGWLSSANTPLAGPVNSSLNSTLPGFNPALGTLTSVDVQEIVNFQTTASVQNTSTSSSNTITVEADLTAALTSSSVSSLQLSKFFAEKFDPFTAAPSGQAGDSTTLTKSDSNITASQTLTDPSSLAQFANQATIPITESLTGTTTISGLPQMSNQVLSNGSATVQVRYHYLPADVAILKTVTPTSAAPGAPVTYTLTVTNNGPGAASNVQVQDPLPAGESLLTATPPAGWTVQSTANGVTFTDGSSLASGATATFTITANAPNAAGQYTNTATVSTTTTDTNPNNNQASSTLTVNQAQTDLSITKAANPTTVAPNGAVTYTLVVTNNGTNAASGVTVQDSLPTGEVLTGSSVPAGWTVQSTTGGITFSDATLAAGASATLTLTVSAPPSAGQYTNTATVSSQTPDSNPNNNQATSTITVTPNQTDLSITKAASPTTVAPNGAVTYTLVVTNNGPTDASGVTVQDTLPAGEILTGTSLPVGWTVQSTTGGVIFNDATLANGASATLTVTVTAPGSAGQFTNTATVSSQTPDSNPNNNQATSTITVTSNQTDLSITKAASPTTVAPNGAVTYTLVVTNNGVNPANGVVVQDSLPAGEVLTGSSLPVGWTVQSTTGGVTFNDATLAAGASATLTVYVTAPASAGQFTNTATVSSQTPDSNPNNNQATSTITVTPNQTDLGITKVVTPTSVAPSGAVTYTIVVTNNGPTDASNVVVQDSLPTGEVLTGSTPPSGWNVQSSSGGVTFTDPLLANGASATFTITATAPANAGQFTNTATVSSQTPDSNPNNNQATATVTVTAQQTDLSITKTASPTTVAANGAVSYTLVVTNNGTNPANGVTVQDSLPAGEVLTGSSVPAGWTVQSTTGGVTFSDATLAAGASATLTVNVTAPANAGQYTNTATVSSQTPDSNPNNNQATSTITVTPNQTDLGITKVVTPTSVGPSGAITYTLTVTNNGSIAATNVVVQDSLPTGEVLTGSTPPSGWNVQSTSGGVTFTDPLLAAGASATFTITATAPANAGQYTNTATVSSQTPDSNPNNNQATATVTVVAPQTDLAITKSANPTTTTPGGAVSYTLLVTNNGPSTATNVVVQDALPTGEVLTGTSLPTGWTVQSTTGGVTFNDASLAAGASATLIVSVAAPNATGTFTNTATVSSDTPDTNPNNNQATATITVNAPPADLSIVKTASPTTVMAGGAVTYTFVVSNVGQGTATNITVQDPLPTGETFVSTTQPVGWSEQNSAGMVTFTTPGSLAPGASATLTLTVTAPGAAGTYSNTASVSSQTPDSNPSNNQSTATITVTPQQADLSIVKTAAPTTVMAGGTVAYTLTVTNLGTSTANGVMVQDALPAGETLTGTNLPTGWTMTNNSGVLTFTDANPLAASGTATLTLTVTAPGAAGTYSNTATVTSQTPDPNPGNNTSTSIITVTPLQADLMIAKSASPTSVLAGGAVTYTLTVTNLGPGTASSVLVQDALPTGEVFVSATEPSGWTVQHSTGLVTFSGPSLASGAKATFTVAVTAPLTAGSYQNTATVSSLTPDPNTANNIASATITVSTAISPNPPPILPPDNPPPQTNSNPPPTTTTTWTSSKSDFLSSNSWLLSSLWGY